MTSVVCSIPCFRRTQHERHNITFYITQQPGGCCDCGDPESWRVPPNCPNHSLANAPQKTHKNPGRSLDVWSPTKYPARSSIPLELRESVSRTIAYALIFILDTLDRRTTLFHHMTKRNCVHNHLRIPLRKTPMPFFFGTMINTPSKKSFKMFAKQQDAQETLHQI